MERNSSLDIGFVEPRGDGGNRPESPGRRDINRVGCKLARRDDLDAWWDLVLWEVLEVVCHDGARVSCDRGGEDMFVIEVWEAERALVGLPVLYLGVVEVRRTLLDTVRDCQLAVGARRAAAGSA
jgi:hypothetical protein